MLLTIGGLFIWTFSDLVCILFGTIEDSKGLKVKTWSESYAFPKVLVSLVLILSMTGFGVSKSNIKIRFLNDLFSKKIVIKAPQLKSDSSMEIIKYVDNNGVTHFVNELSKVPQEYKGRAESNLKLPELNK